MQDAVQDAITDTERKKRQLLQSVEFYKRSTTVLGEQKKLWYQWNQERPYLSDSKKGVFEG